MNISIIGAGHAYPDSSLDSEAIVELCSSIDAEWLKQNTHISSRRTVLPLEYLKVTGNHDPYSAHEVAQDSPTSLAFKAAELALQRAGISAEKLGLIIADVDTPLETTPSEAQRVGNLFGIKVPAFDIWGGISSAALLLETVSNWKAEDRPKYILLVCAATPTRLVNYKDGIEGAFFGDAASAVVVTASSKGLCLEAVSYDSDNSLQNLPVVVDTYGSLKINTESREDVKRVLSELCSSFSKDSAVMLSPFDGSCSVSVYESAGIEAQARLSNELEVGNCLAAAPFAVLSENWDKLSRFKQLNFALAGSGNSGSFSLNCQGGA